MAREKTLNEALKEIDRWSAKLVARIQHLSPVETVRYFEEAGKRHKARIKKRKPRKVPAKT